jgi:DNA-binding NarL/FixJ family response regulator
MDKIIKLAILEDNSVLRNRLIELIGLYSDIELSFSAGNSTDFMRRLNEQKEASFPDVILMDIELPDTSGIETTSEVKSLYPDLDILMFTVFEDDDRIFQAIQAGASGYLLKDETVETIVESIRELHNGGAPMSAQVARKVMHIVRARSTSNNVINDPHLSRQTPFDLTSREVEILQRLVEGRTNSVIAEELFLSPWTVKTHVKSIYRKMHVGSRAEVTKLAMRSNLV